MAQANSRRAWRRQHRERAIKHALGVVRYVWRPQPWARAPISAETWEQHERENHKMALRLHDHLKVCSCWMCGHRRRYQGPTVQELKAREAMRTDACDWK